MKIRPVEPSCSMRTDRRTDMKKLTVAFRNFAKAPKYRLYFPLFKSNLLHHKLSPSVFSYTVALVSGFSRDCVQPKFTRTSEHSLGTFREEHLVFISSSPLIINALTLTMGRVSAVGSGTESRWRRDFPRPSRQVQRPNQTPIQREPGLSWGKAARAWL